MTDYTKMTKEELIKELEKRDHALSRYEGKTNIEEDPDPLPSLQFKNTKSNLAYLETIKRFSRQLILPEFGPSKQDILGSSAVLIVGCGGLGCPAAIYLAAAGISTLGLVDYDDVELSNLHRQILHTESSIGMSKAFSVKNAVKNLNSKVTCLTHTDSVTSSNIMEIIKKYDIVLDCTDNVATRYLLNDACFFLRIPLVSGAALRFEGQLTIYGLDNGPCYRCLYPVPPAPENVTNCSEGGVLGVVPGIIGTMQALEAIKVLCGIGEPCSGQMLIFDALTTKFRNIKVRNRSQNCQLCGSNPTINELIDYEAFCGARATDKDQNVSILEANHRITCRQLSDMIKRNDHFLLVDVRPSVELEICRLGDPLNVPIRQIESKFSKEKVINAIHETQADTIICICRRGNDSQRAVNVLQEYFPNQRVCDVIGGLTSWAAQIDKTFPVY
ncbi:Adenylyltransferase and sulfurtransferase MOCS3-2 [Armadillidium nasatum]|uniref:Adenylyltransferase and sulfurtransferase MOCS3 homolog n=1 Tax=Armadillidium nasatum TaxID=96803 RepID=A0A5N5SXR9_9CRUS|nr:Adenylyltransferase and sulfurtransferase MOCS3-2 [Armadillidium nasatum]